MLTREDDRQDYGIHRLPNGALSGHLQEASIQGLQAAVRVVHWQTLGIFQFHGDDM